MRPSDNCCNFKIHYLYCFYRLISPTRYSFFETKNKMVIFFVKHGLFFAELHTHKKKRGSSKKISFFHTKKFCQKKHKKKVLRQKCQKFSQKVCLFGVIIFCKCTQNLCYWRGGVKEHIKKETDVTF